MCVCVCVCVFLAFILEYIFVFSYVYRISCSTNDQSYEDKDNMSLYVRPAKTQISLRICADWTVFAVRSMES